MLAFTHQRPPRRFALFLSFVAVVITVTAACTSGTTPTPTPTPEPTPTPTVIPTPHPITFPLDEAPHRDRLEWWYYNGHLTDEDGNKYGFHFVVFQGRSNGGAVGYMAHTTVTDLDRDVHDQSSRTSTGEQPQPSEGFSFEVQDWNLQGTPDAHSFQSDTEDYALDLTMSPAKPAVLHDEDGFLISPEGWTYYYTWPRMETQGTLTRDGQTLQVTGSAWMDHQWGDFSVSGYPAGWQWFAVQFDDDTQLMVTEFRDSDGQTSLYGTLIDADGKAKHLPDDDLILEVLDTWTSPTTEAEYPARWRLTVMSQNLEIELRPLVVNQEVTVAFPPTSIYWEGKVSVAATREGTPLSGDAFVELVGYVRIPGLTPPN